METVLLVPGYGESVHSRDYSTLMRVIESRGYDVIFHGPDWGKEENAEVWIQGLKSACDMHRLAPHKTILAGFSYGAFICLMAATTWRPKKLWLWSLASPYGDKRPGLITDKARQITCQTTLIIGEEETRQNIKIRTRVFEAFWHIDNSRLLFAQGADHDPLHPGYVTAIRRAL